MISSSSQDGEIISCRLFCLSSTNTHSGLVLGLEMRKEEKGNFEKQLPKPKKERKNVSNLFSEREAGSGVQDVRRGFPLLPAHGRAGSKRRNPTGSRRLHQLDPNGHRLSARQRQPVGQHGLSGLRRGPDGGRRHPQSGHRHRFRCGGVLRTQHLNPTSTITPRKFIFAGVFFLLKFYLRWFILIFIMNFFSNPPILIPIFFPR